MKTGDPNHSSAPNWNAYTVPRLVDPSNTFGQSVGDGADVHRERMVLQMHGSGSHLEQASSWELERCGTVLALAEKLQN